MKFVIPSQRLFIVAITAGLLAVLPLFVVLAAQGQITEVNPSGVSGLKGTVSIANPDDLENPTVLTINANTSWKIVGKDENAGVVARFNFSATDPDSDGAPVLSCNGVGGSLTGLVAACSDKLGDSGSELDTMILAIGAAAIAGLAAIGVENEASFSSGSGIADGG